MDFLQLWKGVYEALFGGTKGPGKTDCLIMEATRQITNPNYHALLIRRTFKQLQEIMDRAQIWYPSLGGEWNGQSSRWTFKNGSRITMGHCHHEGSKYNYQGHEYHFMGFDQLEQFTQSQYLYLLAQQRTSDPSLYCYVRSTANPGGVGHGWVKRRFIDLGDRQLHIDTKSKSTRMFVYSSLDENPSLMVNDPTYVDRLALGGDAQYRAFRFGDWDSFEGQFFTMWRREQHVILPFSMPQQWKRAISLDYGYSAPSSVHWWATDPNNRSIAYKELYQERLTYSDLAGEILERTDCKREKIGYLVADPAIWSDISHHKGEMRGETGYEVMQKIFNEHSAHCGCDPIRIIKADNDRVNGWIRMREMLAVGQDGIPGVQAFSNCVNLIRTLPEQIHDETRVEDLNTNGEDHAVDDVRYFLMSRPVAADKPPPLPTETTIFWDKVRTDQKRAAMPKDDIALLT